jgi:hypothetical protein
MCATTDAPKQQEQQQQQQQQQQANRDMNDQQQDNPPPSSSRSSYLTPISISSRMDFHEEEEDISTSSSTKMRLQQRQRQPSLVESDFGNNGDDHDEDESQRSNSSSSSKIHSTHVPDTHFCGHILFPNVCQGADQLDIFMACRHPLDLLSMFHEEDGNGPSQHEVIGGGDHTSNNCDSENDVHRVCGYYAIPTSCEYCGSPHIDQCTANCQRPRSFFPRQRPPFCPKDESEWDTNDFATHPKGE